MLNQPPTKKKKGKTDRKKERKKERKERITLEPNLCNLCDNDDVIEKTERELNVGINTQDLTSNKGDNSVKLRRHL